MYVFDNCIKLFYLIELKSNDICMHVSANGTEFLDLIELKSILLWY
jgi:hypothetical protein